MQTLVEGRDRLFLRHTSLSLKISTRKVLVGAAVLALLFFASSIGEALHHHDSASPDYRCQICHVSHQSVEKTAQNQDASAPVLLGSLPAPATPVFVDSARIRLLPTRAPPTA